MEMQRLSRAILTLIRKTGVTTPGYDLDSEVRPGVIHFGLGRFAAAHPFAVMDRMLSNGFPHARVVAVNCRRKGPVQRLREQDLLYTLVTTDGKNTQSRVIGCIAAALYAKDDEDRQQLWSFFRAPTTRLVTVTVTQNGYCQDPVSKLLAQDEDTIAADIADPENPYSFLGMLVQGMAIRFEAGMPALTVMSLDNLPGNGTLLRDMVIQLAKAQKRPAEFMEFLVDEGVFPVSTVDRITPAEDAAARQAMEADLGYEDPMLISSERFLWWIIQEMFSGEPPPLEQVKGVSIVGDIERYWQMKFYLLNAIHTVIASIGQRLGSVYIHDVVAVSVVADALHRIMRREVAEMLELPKGYDVDKYIAELLKRFGNAMLMDKVSRVGAEGTRKIPKYPLALIKMALKQEQEVHGLMLVVACWLFSLGGTTEAGGELDLKDPKLDTVDGLHRQVMAWLDDQDSSDEDLSAILVQFPPIFGKTLGESAVFAAQLATALRSIKDAGGIKKALRNYVAG